MPNNMAFRKIDMQNKKLGNNNGTNKNIKIYEKF